MKNKVSRRFINDRYTNIICVGYCNLQRLLTGVPPMYYTTRVEGWAADVYELNHNTVVVTGYAPFGNIKPEYDLQRKYEMIAARIIGNSYFVNTEDKETKLAATRADFVNECLNLSQLTKKDLENIKNNYNSFIANFGVPRLVREDYGRGYYVFFPGDSESYIQFCHNSDYLDGWLYGAVQAANRKEFANNLRENKNYGC